MRYSELVNLLEDLVNTPIYTLIGHGIGNNLILLSNEGGIRGLWLLDKNTLRKERITTHPVSSVASMPIGTTKALYTVDVSRGREQHLVYYVDLERCCEEIPVEMNPVRVIGIAFDGEKTFFAGATQEDISLYMIQKGHVERLFKIPRGFAFVTHARKGFVVGFGVLAGNPFSSEIFVFELRTMDFKVYTPKSGSVNKDPIITEEGKVVFSSSALSDSRDVLIALDPGTGAFEELVFIGRDYYEYSPVENVFFEQYEGRWIVIGKKNGRTRIFLDGFEVVDVPGVADKAIYIDGKVYYSYSSFKIPSEVVELNLETRNTRTIIESKAPRIIEDSISDIGLAWVKSIDGLEIPTWYIVNKRAGKPGPAVIYVHGGPWSEVSDSWRTMIAAILASGFNIIAPNFRGSTGYGTWFRNLDIGDPGGGDLEDIIATTKWAVESGLASKTYILGYSYGGYMTLWAMSNRPELYECGVAGASVVDWDEMYELSDTVFKSFIDILFSGKRELLKERSPIAKAANISKPLCIIHPQNDTRTPLKPVLKLLSRLLEYGKSYEVHIAPDMGHTINTVEDAMKILLPAILFLARCLKQNQIFTFDSV